MSTEPGERRRRRELERARELAAERVTGAAGSTASPLDSRPVPPTTLMVPTPGVPRQGPAAPPLPQQGPSAVPAVPQPTSAASTASQPTGAASAASQPAPVPPALRAVGAADDRPLSRRELRERERRRAAGAGEADTDTADETAPGPAADGEARPQARRSAGTVPEQRSPATTAAPGPAGASTGSGRDAAAAPTAASGSAANPIAAPSSTPAPAATPSTTPIVSTSDPEVTSPGPRAEDLGDDVDPHPPHRYTWKHYVALALVALVLGFVVWSLITVGDPGALSAAAHPTQSPPVAAALRGVL